jgi:hypothetical protein
MVTTFDTSEVILSLLLDRTIMVPQNISFFVPGDAFSGPVFELTADGGFPGSRCSSTTYTQGTPR